MTITSGSSNPLSGITRGVIGLAKSKDLVNWEVCPSIYTPNLYPSMECSDIFKINDYWYMIFSQYGHTEYRMAASLYGPWIAPENPVLDGGLNFFYAAKTLFDGERRLLFGWCGTLQNGDSMIGEWGGDMVSPREIFAGENGLLEIKCPSEMKKGYIECNYDVIPKVGNWHVKNSNNFENRACEGFSAVHLSSQFDEGVITARINPKTEKGKCGFLLHSSDDLADCYLVSIDVGLNVLEIYRRKSINTFAGVLQEGIRLLLTQHLSPEILKKEISIELYYENRIAEVFIGNKSVSTIRLNDLKGGCTGFFTTDNSSEFTDVHLLKK
jgi:beta-fructofuranosidase